MGPSRQPLVVRVIRTAMRRLAPDSKRCPQCPHPRPEMISIREFARRDGCSEKRVRNAIQTRISRRFRANCCPRTWPAPDGAKATGRGADTVRTVRTKVSALPQVSAPEPEPLPARPAACQPWSSAARRIWRCCCCASAWHVTPSRNTSTSGSRSSGPVRSTAWPRMCRLRLGTTPGRPPAVRWLMAGGHVVARAGGSGGPCPGSMIPPAWTRSWPSCRLPMPYGSPSTSSSRGRSPAGAWRPGRRPCAPPGWCWHPSQPDAGGQAIVAELGRYLVSAWAEQQHHAELPPDAFERHRVLHRVAILNSGKPMKFSTVFKAWRSDGRAKG